jgi:hypothetical protein
VASLNQNRKRTGVPARQPRWGGGSARVPDSTEFRPMSRKDERVIWSARTRSLPFPVLISTDVRAGDNNLIVGVNKFGALKAS